MITCVTWGMRALGALWGRTHVDEVWTDTNVPWDVLGAVRRRKVKERGDGVHVRGPRWPMHPPSESAGNKDEWRVEGSWGQDLGAGENSHFLLTSVCTLAPDTTSRSRPDWSKVEDVGYWLFCCVRFGVETELQNTDLRRFDSWICHIMDAYVRGRADREGKCSF